MPSKRKLVGVRLTEEDVVQSEQARTLLQAKLGVAISLSDLYRLGVAALLEKHGDDDTRPRGRPRKEKPA